MFSKSVLVVFLMTLSMSLAKEDDMVKTALGTQKKLLKEVSIKEATKYPEIYTVDMLKHGVKKETKQLERGMKSTTKYVEHGYMERKEELKKIVEKINKEYLVLTEKFKKMYEKTRELTKISEEISKNILNGDKIQKCRDKTKDSLRPLEQMKSGVLIKKIKNKI